MEFLIITVLHLPGISPFLGPNIPLPTLGSNIWILYVKIQMCEKHDEV
jgi:hypothetical protein